MCSSDLDDRCRDKRLRRTDCARDLHTRIGGMQTFNDARDAWVVAEEGEEVGEGGQGCHELVGAFGLNTSFEDSMRMKQ